MKRCVTICAMLLACLTQVGYADTETVNGITWTYTVSNGEASLGGGTTSSTAVPTSTTGTITIPSKLGGYPVTSIGDYAFYRCSGLTSVTIPNGVTSIGREAFSGCSSMFSAIVPDSVKAIGSSLFSGCCGLTEIVLPFIGARRGNSGTPAALFGYIFGETPYSGGTKVLQYSEAQDVYYAYYIPSTLRRVVITDETTIGDWAFCSCNGLTSVTIPDTVVSVGYYPFSGCYNLTNVVVSQYVCRSDVGIRTMFPSAYRHISSVSISDAVTTIGGSAFEDCVSLTSIKIPDGVTAIYSRAFYGCSNLVSVAIPDSVITIGQDAFAFCNEFLFDTSTILGAKLVDGWAVGNTGFSSHDLDLTGVRGIGDSAFSGCVWLTNVIIPSDVTKIGWYAFQRCQGLTNVKIPDGVTRIGFSAFSECSSLTNVVVGNSVANIDGFAFDRCRMLHTATIGSGITNISETAFNDCESLTSVYVADNYSGAENVFQAGATIVRYKPNQTVFLNANGGFVSPESISVTYGADYGILPLPSFIGHTFIGWMSDEQLVLPNTIVSTLSDHELVALWRTNQYMVTFDANGGSGGMSMLKDYGSLLLAPVATRPGYTFGGWVPEVAATVPAEDVTYIAQWNINSYMVVFDANGGEGSANKVYAHGESLFMPVVTRRNYDFIGWFTQPEGGDCINDGMPVTGEMTLYAHWQIKPNVWLYDVSNGMITIVGNSTPEGDLVIPPEIDGYPVTAISSNAFYGCVGLTSVKIPDSVDSIGDSAFYRCKDSIFDTTKIPGIRLVDGWVIDSDSAIAGDVNLDGVRGIAVSAFKYRSLLTSVKIGNEVSSIGDYAFYGCTRLESLIIGENVQSIGAYSFANIHSLSKVVIPDSVITIGDHAFERIVSLSEVVVGRGVRYIGDGALSGSEAMEYIGRIIFNGDAPQLGANVFPKASSNCRIYVRYGSSGWGVDIPGRWGVGVFDPAEVADISGSGWYSYKVPASDGEFVFVFTNAGRTVSFTPKTDVSVEEVFVLGGGGGGGPGGGGGGGGESLWITNAVDYAADETGISVYVGRGGSGGDVRYSSDEVRASASHNGSTSWVKMKNPLNTATTDQYQGYGGLRGGYFYRDNDSYSAGYGSYWGGSAGGGSALVTSGHHAGDSVMNAAGCTYGRADYASGFGGAAVDGAPGGGGGGGLRGIATGGGNYADEGARRSVVYAGSDGADGTGGVAGGKGGDGFPISIMGDSPIRVTIGNLVGDQDAWLGGGGGGGSGRNGSGYSEMWGVGAELPGEGGRGGGGSGGLYTAGTYYDYQSGLGKNGAPFTGGGGGGGSFMEPVTNASSAASNWILGGGKGADGFVVMLVKVKSGGGNGWPIDYVHHDVTLDANGGVCSVCSVNVADGPLSEVLPIPTREDAAFLGWFTELEGGEEVDSSTMVLGETTFYAHWLFDVDEPQIVSEGGTEFYADSCAVTITCATPGASIYYTDDGTTPKINELYLYSEPITITDTTTFKAVAVLDGIKSAYATLTITKKALTLQDALDASDGVSVDTESTFPWKPVLDPEAKTGDSSARSAQIGDRESSWLSTTVSGAGKLSFWCKTSCEHDEDDKYSWDRLMVYTNDVEIVDWRMDGETDWTQRLLKFDDGENTVKWVYAKDRAYANGEDCAWVDAVVWRPYPPDATVDVGEGNAIVVPGEWLAEHDEYISTKDEDIDTALKSKSANGRLSVVECYLLGLSPETADDDFKITSFPMKADGSPDLEAITFSPPQSKWNISGATPKLKGKANLSDQWQDVPPGGDQSFRFFTIAVELP